MRMLKSLLLFPLFGCFGGGSPSPPTPPAPAPQAPTEQSAGVQSMVESDRKRRRAAASQTMLTGGKGVTESTTGQTKSLLGQ